MYVITAHSMYVSGLSTYLVRLWDAMVPRENRAILYIKRIYVCEIKQTQCSAHTTSSVCRLTFGPTSGSLSNISSISSTMRSSTITGQRSGPFRMRFPMAPAALARVFSSGSRSAMQSGWMQPDKSEYNSFEWNAAFPTIYTHTGCYILIHQN